MFHILSIAFHSLNSSVLLLLLLLPVYLLLLQEEKKVTKLIHRVATHCGLHLSDIIFVAPFPRRVLHT